MYKQSITTYLLLAAAASIAPSYASDKIIKNHVCIGEFFGGSSTSDLGDCGLLTVTGAHALTDVYMAIHKVCKDGGGCEVIADVEDHGQYGYRIIKVKKVTSCLHIIENEQDGPHICQPETN
jgi:hypothetical protein